LSSERFLQSLLFDFVGWCGCRSSRCLVWILARTLAILTEVFRRFPQSLQANMRGWYLNYAMTFLLNPFQSICQSHHMTLWDTKIHQKYITKKTFLSNFNRKLPDLKVPFLHIVGQQHCMLWFKPARNFFIHLHHNVIIL
jgi:hypothetical protein